MNWRMSRCRSVTYFIARSQRSNIGGNQAKVKRKLGENRLLPARKTRFLYRLSKRVLVVDDDPPIRHLVRTVLNREGYSVDEADGGRDALEKIAWDGYDAIVLDLMMPEISGYDVLGAISQVRPNSKCVVLISAAGSVDIEKADPTIVRAKLRKPFNIHELIKAVDACADGVE